MNSSEALLQTINDLCSICEEQLTIIKAQADALAQMGAVVLEEERLASDDGFTPLFEGEPFSGKEV